MEIREALSLAKKVLEPVSLDGRREGEEILEGITGLSRTDIILKEDHQLTKKYENEFSRVLLKRATGMPLAYIFCKKNFFGLDFYVDKRVLIPRPDTERSVETVKKIMEKEPIDSFLELGVGSGCVSITLGTLFPKIKIHGVEKSLEALEVAEKNRKEYLCQNVTFWESDLFRSVTERYDIIYSNPPYIPKDDLKTLEPSVKDFEPKLALDGGEDGLDFYKGILKDAKKFLKPMGHLVFEIGWNQKESVEKLFNEQGFEVLECVYDYQGYPRVLHGRRKGDSNV